MINKELVKRRFRKNLENYNKNAKVQKQMSEKLFSFLDKTKEYKNILEIGCGTGLLTEKVSEKLVFENYICVDIVPECEEFIKEINENINFISSDIEEFLSTNNNSYDLIISNASLQWIENFEDFGKKLISRLNPNGILLFSTFGTENLREIFFIQGKTLNYHNLEYLKSIFKKYDIKAEEEIRIMSFKTPKEVLKHLKNTGVNGIEPMSWTKKDLAAFENSYNNFCSNNPTLTYNPIYICVNKR